MGEVKQEVTIITSRPKGMSMDRYRQLRRLSDLRIEKHLMGSMPKDESEKETPKKVNKQEVVNKKPYKDGAEWLSETVDIPSLYRVKGREGLFLAIAKPNKAGMIPMRGFMSTDTCTTKRTELEALGGAVIYKKSTYSKKEGKKIINTIALPEAFDNLQKHFDGHITGDITDDNRGEIMEVICPKYDPERFMHYHAKKVCNWYNEIMSSINNAAA